MSLVKTSNKIENFQKSEKSENLVSRSDFCELCPAWLAKIKKAENTPAAWHPSPKLGNSVFFFIYPTAAPCIFRNVDKWKKRSSKQYCFNNNLGILHVCVVSWIFLHVLSQFIDSQSAGWIFKLMQNHTPHKTHLKQCPNGPPDWSFPWLLMIFTELIKLFDVVL